MCFCIQEIKSNYLWMKVRRRILWTTIEEERDISQQILVIEHLSLKCILLSFKLFEEGNDLPNEDFKNMPQCILNQKKRKDKGLEAAGVIVT